MKVGIVMGSDSDWPVMQAAGEVLTELGVAWEADVVSAHRMPTEMIAWGQQAHTRGLSVIIAGAGGAAHLPGMLAAVTPLPVIGVPVPLKYLDGMDSLLSIVQMPGGIPVATVAIGNAKNAGILAARILGDQRPRPPAAAGRPTRPSSPRPPTRRATSYAVPPPAPTGGSASSPAARRTRPRRAFVPARSFFALAAAPSRPGSAGSARRGGGGGASASRSRSARRSRAATRLRCWERCSDAATRRVPSASARSARARWVSVRTVEERTSKSSSTRESVVFTDWPPGPGDFENFSTSSPAGTTRPRAAPGRRGRGGRAYPHCGLNA